MAAARFANVFVTQLHAERDALKRLVAVLRDEQDALVQTAPERLVALSRDKSELLFQIADTKRQRESQLRLPGAKTPLSGEILENHPDPAVRGAWREIAALARTAQQLNQTSGALIDTRLRHTRRALAALRSAANETYGPDGQARFAEGTRARTSA